MKKICCLLIAVVSLGLHAQTPAGDLIIRNGTVLTITKGKLENTDILVQKGKITAIGDNLKAPGSQRNRCDWTIYHAGYH
jgi:predicted amidohydrolase